MVTAKKKGIPNHKLKEWIKRKVECIHVVRMRKDGLPGCSIPCVFCRRLIISFDLSVVCTTMSGEVFKGKMTDSNAPSSKLTSGQAAYFKRCKCK
jgi:hypothetical protein